MHATISIGTTVPFAPVTFRNIAVRNSMKWLYRGDDSQTTHAFHVFGRDQLHMLQSITQAGCRVRWRSLLRYQLLSTLNGVKGDLGSTIANGMNGDDQSHFGGIADDILHLLLRDCENTVVIGAFKTFQHGSGLRAKRTIGEYFDATYTQKIVFIVIDPLSA